VTIAQFRCYLPVHNAPFSDFGGVFHFVYLLLNAAMWKIAPTPQPPLKQFKLNVTYYLFPVYMLYNTASAFRNQCSIDIVTFFGWLKSYLIVFMRAFMFLVLLPVWKVRFCSFQILCHASLLKNFWAFVRGTVVSNCLDSYKM